MAFRQLYFQFRPRHASYTLQILTSTLRLFTFSVLPLINWCNSLKFPVFAVCLVQDSVAGGVLNLDLDYCQSVQLVFSICLLVYIRRCKTCCWGLRILQCQVFKIPFPLYNWQLYCNSCWFPWMIDEWYNFLVCFDVIQYMSVSLPVPLDGDKRIWYALHLLPWMTVYV